MTCSIYDVWGENTFVVVVGRDRMSGTTHEAHVRMKNNVRDAVIKYLRRGSVSFPLAARTAELVLADKLPEPGTSTVYLTAKDIGRYLAQAQKDAPAPGE